jgi:glutaminyl-peptide cyclotransferase
MGDRSPGTAGHSAIQAWIEDQLNMAGWSLGTQSFDYRGVTLTNVVGRSSTSGTPYFIVGAHYDTRPVADQSAEPNPGPVPGADDGASGVAVLLGLADVLPQGPGGCRVDLAFFDGEDSGRLNGWDWIVGSTYMAQHLAQRPDGVVVVDMVGDSDLQLYYERNSDPALSQAIWRAGNQLGYGAFIPRLKYSMIDDHTPFLNQGLPAVDIIDFDYPYWHTPEDTLDKISADSLEAVGRTLQSWLERACS